MSQFNFLLVSLNRLFLNQVLDRQLDQWIKRMLEEQPVPEARWLVSRYCIERDWNIDTIALIDKGEVSKGGSIGYVHFYL